MNPTFKTFAERKQYNETLICNACGKNHRTSLSKLCRSCQHRLNFHGHPLASAVRPKVYKGWMEEAQRLINLNGPDHPAIAYVYRFFELWRQGAIDSPITVPAGRWVRLFPPEAGPELTLWMAGAYLHWKINKPHQWPDSRAFWFAMAKVLIGYIPAPGGHKNPMHFFRTSALDRRTTSLHLLRHVGPLLEGIYEAYTAEERARESAMAIMKTPLKFTTVEADIAQVDIPSPIPPQGQTGDTAKQA